MKKPLIICYGNTLQGDNNLGSYIVENIKDIVDNSRTNVQIMSLLQLDVILASEIQ